MYGAWTRTIQYLEKTLLRLKQHHSTLVGLTWPQLRGIIELTLTSFCPSEAFPSRGEPSRPECTSTTDHVQVPGLMLLPNFVTPEEEASLLAVLLGPQAPWAPSQSTPTEGGVVKRRVQHYGYVFDYETADVLRDRVCDGEDKSVQYSAACPPLPVMDIAHEGNLNNQQELHDRLEIFRKEGRGWKVLAGIIERARQTKYCDENIREGLTYPNLNQLTVNHYAPAEGIGSHVDTPSAFADGLLSLSLNSGIVMEFRHVGGQGMKKLLYLPPRSLVAMTGAARYEWEHMIVTRRTDVVDGVVLPRQVRVSLIFRTALALDGTPLPRLVSDQTPPRWGNQDGSTDPEHKAFSSTPDCEKDHVHAVYDAIAKQWHHISVVAHSLRTLLKLQGTSSFYPRPPLVSIQHAPLHTKLVQYGQTF